MWWPAAGWIAALLGGCGQDPAALDASSADLDAALDAAPGDAALHVDPPAPVALPAALRLDPCPSGWRPSGSGDETWCDPWPEGGRPECPAGEVAFPGEAACAPIGAPCPVEGPWPEGLPDDGSVIFVRAPAGDPVPGGAGSRDVPYETIAEALAVAAPGGVIALSTGTFHEAVALTAPVTLRGACAGGSILDSPLPSGGGTVQVYGTGMVVRDVEVRGEGIWVRPDGAVRLEGVLVSGADPFGIAVNEGELTGARVVVRDTVGTTLGLGIHVQAGRAQLEQVSIERSHLMGLSVAGAELVAVSDLVVQDTHPGSEDELGVGVAVVQGGVAEIDRAVFERCHGAGVFVQEHASTLRLTDGVIRDTIHDLSSDEGGMGVSVVASGAVELERVVIERNETAGIGLTEGATAVVRDLLVRDTTARALDGIAGVGIGVAGWSDLDGERVALVRNHGSGISVEGEGTTVRLADLLVRDSESQPADQEGGFGLSFSSLASVALERARLDHNRTAGIYGTDGATLTATDLTIDDTESHPSGILGRGLTLQGAARADVERASVSGNREVSLFAAGADTVLDLRDVSVDRTLERACVEQEDGCPTSGAGTGIVSILSAVVDVRRFAVQGSAICGVQVAREGSLALHDGEVRNNPIGANVQVDGFDLALLQDRVVFHDNGRNLDSSVLAVPDPSLSR